MKKHILYYIFVSVACLLGATACSDDFSQPPVVLPEGGIGSGEWDNPMTAYQCLLGSLNSEIEEPWVKGYIVGVVNTEVGNVLNERCAQFEAPFNVNTNLLIAMNPDETNWENCATVQLPSGAVRSALNLSDNPDNKGKLVTIKGTTGEKYCGAYGLRSASDYNWGDTGKKPVELTPIDGPFLETFDATTDFSAYKQQGWKNVMVLGGLDGWYIREFSGNNYITVSAYKGTVTGGPYENWLITPAIDLAKITEKTLEFRTQAAYQAENSTLEVFVMTTDNPSTSESTKLNANIASAPASGYSSWVESGKLDLSGFSGTIYIGWRYYSAHGGQDGSTTYCIDDVNVGNATEPSNPVTPPGGDDSAIYSGLNENDATIDWTFENILLPAGMSYIWDWKEYNGKHYLNASAYYNNANNQSEAVAYSPVVSLKETTGAVVTFDHAAKFQTTITTLGRFIVREKGAGEWTEYEIPTWPTAGSWTFVSSGSIDISAFAGKEIEIGFKYASTSAGADTWEIKNVKVLKK
ncbi:MAG: hypothetical protein HDS84_01585 [Bacteroidales bacterium]|nr:hypothetical protein [Bacteroidales bacterium]MBD5205058.1 hypothetical protein [Bacteroidales bacterium]